MDPSMVRASAPVHHEGRSRQVSTNYRSMVEPPAPGAFQAMRVR
jgi:hypothetical protein